MRMLLLAALLYLFCLIQIGFAPFAPDLVLLALFVVALHASRLAATALALFCGLCLDLASPATLGASILAYTALTYGASSLHSFVYRGRWHMLAIALAGLALKYLVHYLARVGLPPTIPLVVSSMLTLILAMPAERLLSGLFYTRWKTG